MNETVLPGGHGGCRPHASAGVNLLLVGPMGAGKSSIARRLCDWTGRRVFDTDWWIRHDQGERTIADIFATEGEAFFRERETAALRAIRHQQGLVVATGGGIVLSEENRALLGELGCVAWLTADEDTLFQRVSRNRQRPLLHTADPRATLRAILHAREPLYRACADFQVDTTLKSHAQAASAVLAQAHERFPEDFPPPCPLPRSKFPSPPPTAPGN